MRSATFRAVTTAQGEKCYCPDARTIAAEDGAGARPPEAPATPEQPSVLLWTFGPAQATLPCGGNGCEQFACSPLSFSPASALAARSGQVIDEVAQLTRAAGECERSRLEVEQHVQSQLAKVKSIEAMAALSAAERLHLMAQREQLAKQVARPALTVDGLVASVQAALGAAADGSCKFSSSDSTPGYCVMVSNRRQPPRCRRT